MGKNKSTTYLLISLGSIGKRHLENLRQIDKQAHIIILRRSVSIKNNDKNISEVQTLEQALALKPTIAIIASPAVLHIEQSLMLLKHNIHIFIEKPLSHNLDGINEVINLAKEKSLIVMVGYVLRFSPVLRKIKSLITQKAIGNIINFSVHCGQYLPDWRPNLNYQNTVSAQKKLGGGVLLELSHEFDYLRWLFGDIKAVVSNIVNTKTLKIDVEDKVDVLLKFNNGVLGFVHLNFLEKESQRSLKINGADGNIDVNLIDDTISLNLVNNQKNFDFPQKRNNLYLEELICFLNCIENQKQPPISLNDGLEVIKVIEAIKQSFVHKHWVKL